MQPEPLKLESLKLKSLGEGMVPEFTKNARVFIPSTRPPAPEAPPPPPTFSEAELKAAERDGFQKGFIEGVKDGHRQAESEQAAINETISTMAATFAEALRPLLEHYTKFAATVYAEMPKIALTIAQKVAGPALQENAELLVADIATRACETLMNEATLTITANEALGDTLERMLQAVAARLPEHSEIIILRDPDMPKADCRIDWKNGTLEHSVQELWSRVEKAINNLTAVNIREGQSELQQLEQDVLRPSLPETNEPKE